MIVPTGPSKSIKINIFDKLPRESTVFIASQLNQTDKYNLLRSSGYLYTTLLPTLYEKVVVISTSTSINVREIGNGRREFHYPNDKSIVSDKRAIKKFFKTINKTVYNHDGKIRISTLMNLFHCYYSLIPEGFKTFNDDSDKYYTLDDLEDTFFDCFHEAFDFEKTEIPISEFFCLNVFKCLVKLTYCKDICVPSMVYSKLIYNLDHYDYIRDRKVERGVDQTFKNYYKKFLKGELFLDFFRISNGLKLSLSNLTNIRVSFADPFLARSILGSCDSSKLKKLTLDHMCCGHDCESDHLKTLTHDQLNRKFLLIDEFFKLSHIKCIFNRLQDLELVFHNGYNRAVFRKFLFGICHFIVTPNKKFSIIGGKLKLKSLVIRETTSNFTKIREYNHKISDHVSQIHRREVQKSCTLLLFLDLVSISNYFTIFDLIDFTKIEKVDILTKYFPKGTELDAFLDKYFKSFYKNLIVNMKNPLAPNMVTIGIEQYDKSVMVAKAVIHDDESEKDENKVAVVEVEN
ncbi:hypothetical protein WICANDRAFT_64777 [Wickerhamomyces anomalus NRRL Y-366-8]|uniref:Uncharacterized protein n=1 Tax=Wickerhamomyces anomalus (strain ATCC 58044 / CBS 1984 / NCYC 433 / NRRL Y-366-8) TaxID=683960 RepID=A0A1E3NW43_WICAA|nr:uncharacterized protein WICANDRAFT_64777 [Wickerhamomyces anomalus NRRL Y-366-8]ODQ57429.1 hypothetical protein WICANDRAFT_64777 [Wickerhamomyces anomalus NRRL Y-366-8]